MLANTTQGSFRITTCRAENDKSANSRLTRQPHIMTGPLEGSHLDAVLPSHVGASASHTHTHTASTGEGPPDVSRTLTDTYMQLTNPYKPTKTDDCNYTVAVQLRSRQREEATRHSKHTHTHELEDREMVLPLQQL